MAVLISNLTHDGVDSGSESFGDQTTASIAPVSGSIVFVAVGSNHPSTGVTTPTISGLSMTWTQITTLPSSDNKKRITLFRGVANGNSGVVTISHGGQPQQNVYWGISQVLYSVMSGTNGSDAVVQSNTGNFATTTPSVSLSAFSDLNNATFGVIYYADNFTVTPGSGFSEVGVASHSHRLESEYKNTSDTSVDWSLPNNTDAHAIAVEVKSLLYGGAGILPAFM